MQQSDFIRIKHMIDAAEEAISFAEGKQRKDLDKERMLVLSVIKEIEIIGEAASKISIEVKAEYSNIPWDEITGMRNHLVHGYFDVDLDMLWNTIKQDLPSLITNLKKI
ncbi:MAG: DUF86 domain-containing protein [Ignavibacteriota bacterium]|jgi:uncharacterized protein with HEPN domain|nr:MAG: DUF86 domain-containing protein [Chlorobiota bacterium]MBE7476222.1 DUF86 domain-containing protein [Ignavibacteriales bacterium]MBL1124503.1 DUF86 domain-containing protein [Ignavibacteriota bacterium]MCE7858118.1 DUF86 domain-containing protein [Ignavibacteria bacterium CHB3]MEB2297976.1 DUF86 domain-containing protein [Ignavibacteria bacterium]GJQ43470.1 MAG: hypothetical protein JETCAE03_29680 [Ignavibacteriaceae bacterium]